MDGNILRRLVPTRPVLAAAILIPALGAHAAPAHKAASAVAAFAPAPQQAMVAAKRSAALLRETMLAVHNAERRALGVPPLEWDDALAREAGRYAMKMAADDAFRHSDEAERAGPFGENLWRGSRRLFDYAAMVDAFLGERKYFRPEAKFPDSSVTGRWQDVGHYTQLIWRGSRKLGCALGEGARYDYLVCRYFPAGNVLGEGPFDPDDPTLPTPLPVSVAGPVEAKGR